jgi:uncharacterized phage protein (TIGR02218 family)
MRTPEWEASPGALATLLNSRAPLVKADIYTLTLAGGTVLRWSGSDQALVVNSQTYTLGPKIKRDRVRFVVGVEVSSLNVTLWDEGGTLINGKSLVAFAAARALFGAKLKLSRVFWGHSDLGPVGSLLWFTGRIADTQVNRYEVKVVVKSDIELLDVMVPGEVYQPSCLNTLYDSACGAVRASFTTTAAATAASSSARTVFGHSLAPAAGYFDLGVVKFNTGANAGISRTVKQHLATTLSVLQPWPFQVAVSDSFEIVPGCNRSFTDANGCSKFYAASEDRVKRFRGQPFIPVPETVI